MPKMKELNLSYVPRWTIVPMLRQQTVSDHCWRVAIIAYALVRRMDLGAPIVQEAVIRAVYHDMNEILTGDIPSTVKAPPLFDDMPDVELLVKVADYTESLTWAQMWAHPSVRDEVCAHVWERLRAASTALYRRFPGIDVLTCVAEIRREVYDEP